MVCRRKKRRRIVTEEGGKAKLEHALPVSASLFSLLPVSLRFPSSAVPARASDEPPGVARPGPGGDKRRGGQAAPHEACAARGRCSSSGRPPRYPCARWGAGAGQRLRSAVDARGATPAWMRQAARSGWRWGGRAAALHRSPSTPPITAQCVARFDHHHAHNCLSSPKLHREIQ